MSESAVQRPSLWQWLRYAFGAALPPGCNEWVLRDTTGPGWVLRHLLRTTVQIGPVLVVAVLVLPAPALIVVPMILGGALIGYIYSVAYMIQSTEHRLMKAGYPEGTGEAVREQRAGEAQKAEAQRYRDRLERASQRRRARAERIDRRRS